MPPRSDRVSRPRMGSGLTAPEGASIAKEQCHESEGRDDVAGHLGRARHGDPAGHPHHAAAAHQRIARDRRKRPPGGDGNRGRFSAPRRDGTQRRRPRWLEFLIGPGRLADEYRRSHGRKISEIMTADPITVTEETSLEEVIKLMEKRQIKRLPVVRGDKVVGIVSRANLMHALAGIAREVKPTETSDQVIRELVLAELTGQLWAPVSLINVTVRDGVVDLWGTITDERERSAIVVAAENVPGAKAVNDHLVWIDPTSGLVLYQPNEEPA